MKLTNKCFVFLSFVVLFTGCTSMVPKTFNNRIEPSWSIIEIRDELTYDQAWEAIFNILSYNFDMKTTLKDEGYIQTAWSNIWLDNGSFIYKARTTVVFSDNRKQISIKIETLVKTSTGGIIGSDFNETKAVKFDIMGVVGRVSK